MKEETKKYRLVFIDDELNILSSIKRTLRKEGYEIFTTDDPEQVFKWVQEDEIATVVSDQRMPKMEGVDVLEKVRTLSPDTTRIMLTGYSDIQAATKAINKSNVFRFLAKPWEDSELKEAVKQGVNQYHILAENKRLQVLTTKQNEELRGLNDNLEQKVEERTREVLELNKKLKLGFLGSIQIVDKLAQIHSSAIGAHAKRVTKLVIPIAKKLGVESKDLFEIQVAALLHDVGKVGVPTEILEKNLDKLNQDEKNALRRHVGHGESLVSEIPGLAIAPKVIRHHHEYFNGKGYPDRLSGEEIPLGSRLIAVVDAYDKILNSGESFGSENVTRAIEFISENESILFDPKIVNALKEHLEKTDDHEMEVGLDELLPGMQLSRNVKSSDDKNIAGKGTVLDTKAINIINAWLKKDPLIDAVHVFRIAKITSSQGEEASAGWE